MKLVGRRSVVNELLVSVQDDVMSLKKKVRQEGRSYRPDNFLIMFLRERTTP